MAKKRGAVWIYSLPLKCHSAEHQLHAGVQYFRSISLRVFLSHFRLEKFKGPELSYEIKRKYEVIMDKKIRYTNILTLLIEAFEDIGNPIFPLAINPMLTFLYDKFDSKIPELKIQADAELYLYQECMGDLLNKHIIYLDNNLTDQPYCNILCSSVVPDTLKRKIRTFYKSFHTAINRCVEECDDIDPHYAAIIHSVARICKNNSDKKLIQELSIFRVMDVLQLTYPELDEVAGYEYSLEMLQRNLLDLKVSS